MPSSADNFDRVDSVTTLELFAIEGQLNVSDGHPRQDLTDAQREIVARLPDFFVQARNAPFSSLETRAHAAFMAAVAQKSAPVGTGRMLSTYASSVAIDVVARCLAESAPQVGLVHRTFDNILDLLRARPAITLTPIDEATLSPDGLTAAASHLDALFIVTPNNPTGTVVDEVRLAAVADWCSARGVVLILDASFRGFDTRAPYDMYAVLDSAGVEYVVIEDTGKLWPTLELNLGVLAFSSENRLRLQRAMSDVLLSVSPVVLLLVEQFSYEAQNGVLTGFTG